MRNEEQGAANNGPVAYPHCKKAALGLEKEAAFVQKSSVPLKHEDVSLSFYID